MMTIPVSILAGLAVIGTTLWSAAAEVYPSRPIKVVVPFAPGGTSDILARVVGQRLSERLGQPVVIDNRPGAGGNIGSDLVAKSAPDGYTLILASVGTHAINASLYPHIPYDPLKDFEPITLIAKVPTVLVVHPGLSVRSLQELIAYARAQPGVLTYASAGPGTTQHLAGELFKLKAGVDMIHVPYRGGAPAVTDLVSGQVSLMFPNIPVVRGYIEAGKLRALAVASPARSPAMPDVPTIAEAAGFESFDVNTWFGFLAAARTPSTVVERLHNALVEVVKHPEVKAQLEAQGTEPLTDTPAEFRTYIQAEIAKWANVVKQAGVRVD